MIREQVRRERVRIEPRPGTLQYADVPSPTYTMADFDIDDPTFEDAEDASGDTADDPFDDPSVDVLPVGRRQPTSTLTSLRQEILRTAVDEYYDAMAEKGLTSALGRDYSKFEFVGDRLRLRANPSVKLVNARTHKPLALSTISRQRGGGDIIRDELGFVDWRSAPAPAEPPKLPAQAAAALQATRRQLGDVAGRLEHVELQDLGQVATDAAEGVRNMETTLTDTDIDEILATSDDPVDPHVEDQNQIQQLGWNIRELRGLDQALQRVRGELTNNLAKLTELDEHIEREKEKLADAEDGGLDEHIRRRIADRLRDLQEERAARLEAASANREALRSQIGRIRETIQRILHEDTTLAERIRTLFREQGITIASILTAIGMAISTLVVALTSGSTAPAPSPAPSPVGPDKGGLKEWVKKHLQALGRILAKLASKAAAALPGIIGSIVSWILSSLSKIAGWLAEHIWALVIALGGLLLVAAQDFLHSAKRP